MARDEVDVVNRGLEATETPASADRNRRRIQLPSGPKPSQPAARKSATAQTRPSGDNTLLKVMGDVHARNTSRIRKLISLP